MIRSAKTGFFLILLLVPFISFAQQPPPKNDTVRQFEILRGPSMRSIQVDSITTLQTIAGGAIIRQGTTIFSSDSVVINPVTHIAEAFGNVHINQADSVQTYAQYLKYIGTEKTAYLKKDVRLNDKKGTVFTQQMDYNLGTGIGNYHNGGKVINGRTTITSRDGTYYSDTKDVYFKNDVEVTEPKNHITTDSLLYNMQSQGSNFSGNTYIRNKEVDIYTTQGTYDFNTGNAVFSSRTSVKDSSGKVYIANNMATDDKSGNAQLEGNAIVKDSANGVIVFANQIFLNKKNNSFLATRKPVLIIKQKRDSIYVAADTIFSGYTSSLKNDVFVLKKDSVLQDSLQLKTRPDTAKSAQHVVPVTENPKNDSNRVESRQADSLNKRIIDNRPQKIEQAKKERIANDSASISYGRRDSTSIHSNAPGMAPKQLNARDSATYLNKDTLHQKNFSPADSNMIKLPADLANNRDSVKNMTPDSINKPDSAVRKILAFHHVRIFSDSLQSVCDSLFFTSKDSVFRLYYDPVIWSGRSQITGDTIFLFTKNKNPERLYVFERGMIINKTAQGFYNQIAGKTINGYFVNGAIDYMRVKGSQSESIYYAQDEDSAYVGMNRATGDVIDLYFKNDDLKKVLFVNDIRGKMYPMKQIPEDQKFLKNFIWLDNRRPKNKLELFE
jgi:lipopolysaccharide export system protein LptA